VHEGTACSAGIGSYLANKKIPVIYLQNSGLGNLINPYLSLAHKKIYSIPLIFLVGWRGAPGKKDEEQHLVTGNVTKKLLTLMNIKTFILNNDNDLIKIKSKVSQLKKKKETIAFLIKKDTIKKERNIFINNNHKISREYFLKQLLLNCKDKYRIVSSTGFISREIDFLRTKYQKNQKYKDFYLVGGMGHTLSLSLGYLLKKNNKLLCIDGDGSMLMHLGSFLDLSSVKKIDFKYILLNNESHLSVGGQSTSINNLKIKDFSYSVGFNNYFQIKNNSEIKKKIEKFLKSKNKSFLEVKVTKNSIQNLSRPKNLKKIKNNFL